EVARDVVKHPFVLAGMTALSLLLPLAATSTNAMIRRLGAARWRALHRLIYVIAPIAVFQYWWGKLAKNNTADPKVYALVLALLLGWRVVRALRARQRAAGAA
ncbi:MAG: ferric reductase-like transmembrane domain-containing protein, partial [Betaproteobacteria bacterium]|nr:ferric reductase-like transmembrane domain-containing protein [Betaproteobacteria bacterium]